MSVCPEAQERKRKSAPTARNSLNFLSAPFFWAVRFRRDIALGGIPFPGVAGDETVECVERGRLDSTERPSGLETWRSAVLKPLSTLDTGRANLDESLI